MSIKQITSFYDFEKWLEGKQQHVEELEHENIELTRENMKLKREMREIKDFCLQENRKLQQEVDRLKKSQAEYINQILKKSPAATEDVPKIFKSIK